MRAIVQSETNIEIPEIPEIDGFEPLQFLGEGGYGRVYKYRQAGSLRREVAIKVIRSNLACKEVVSRFEIESQALARCNHSNIASVYEVGTTVQGLPYIVMEFCSGTPLSDWIADSNPSLDSRIEAIRLACMGVSHAHSKGIVHRDIKPKNLMIDDSTGEIVVKVIDFGLAKAVDEPLNEFSTVTGRKSGIGTWDYMSPEQASGLSECDSVLADIYSLGGVLYFALTGIPPHGRMKGIPESLMLKKINEEFVLDPTEIVKFSHIRGEGYCTEQIPAELNLICQKAISIESSRRYESVDQFISDLVLSESKSGPLLASSPSFFYKSMFFMRLYKKGVAVVFIAFLALVINLQMAIQGNENLKKSNLEKTKALSELETKSIQLEKSMEIIETKKNEADKNLRQLETMLAFHANQISQVDIGVLANKVKEEYLSREKSRKSPRILSETSIVQSVNENIVDAEFASVSEDDEGAFQEQGNETNSSSDFDFAWLINESLREGVFGKLDNSLSLFKDEPDLHAKISEFYSRQFVHLGYWDQSLALQKNVVEIREKYSAKFDENRWRSEFFLGHIYGVVGEYSKAIVIIEELLNNRNRLINFTENDEGAMLAEIAFQNLMLGNYQEAENGFRSALSLLGSRNKRLISVVLCHQGLLFLEIGKTSEAKDCFKKSRKLKEGLLDHDGFEFVNLLTNEGKYFAENRDLEKSYKKFHAAWEECRDHVGIEHPRSLVCRNNLGYNLIMQGKYDEAHEQFSELKKVIEDSNNGSWRHEYLSVLNNLGVLYKKQGDFEASEKSYLESLSGYESTFGPDHPKSFGVLLNYAVLKMYVKDNDEALELFDKAHELGSSFLIPDSTDLLFCQANLGYLCSLNGQGEKAIRLLDLVFGKYRSSLGLQAGDTKLVLKDLLVQYEKSGQFSHAMELVDDVLAEVEAGDLKSAKFNFQLLIMKSNLLNQQGMKVKALAELRMIRTTLSEGQNLDQESKDQILGVINDLDQEWQSNSD